MENLAHETLYEYSPSKYYEIAEEELPVVIRDREMQRRHTGEVKSERVKGRVWEESYLSSEWVISGEEAKELMEEEEELEFYELEIFNPKMKKKVNYLITDDEQRDIYTIDEDEQPDEHVGRLVGKNNKAHFF